MHLLHNDTLKAVVAASELKIVSKNKIAGFGGNFMQNMFDLGTSLAIIATIVTTILFFNWVSSLPLGLSFILALDICVNKGSMARYSSMSNQGRTQLMAMMASMTGFIFTVCFSGQIISNLLVKSTGLNIKTLEDLARQPDVKVIVFENSNFHKFLLNTNNGKGLVNKIDARDMSHMDNKIKV